MASTSDASRVAARDGEVVHAEDGARDGNRSRTNLITVRHDDGTVALCCQPTLNGVQVTVGQFVLAGKPIRLCGDTGNTGGLPGEGGCPSIPVNFRNTRASPDGLESNGRYKLRPYE